MGCSRSCVRSGRCRRGGELDALMGVYASMGRWVHALTYGTKHIPYRGYGLDDP